MKLPDWKASSHSVWPATIRFAGNRRPVADLGDGARRGDQAQQLQANGHPYFAVWLTVPSTALGILFVSGRLRFKLSFRRYHLAHTVPRMRSIDPH